MRSDNCAQRVDPVIRNPGAAARDILFDRDGVLIEDRHYLSDPAQVTLLPGVVQALRRLSMSGCRLFVVSNQSGVGRGYFSLESVQACNVRLAQILAAHGVHFSDMLLCPHSPEEDCACRKPQTGMWDVLRERHGLYATHTVMIGDKLDDVRFGRAAGLYTVLVLSGKGRAQAAGLGLPLPDSDFWTPSALPSPDQPHAVAVDLTAAVDFLEKSHQAF